MDRPKSIFSHIQDNQQPLIKVCGMRDYNNIVELNKNNIDLIGFIFYSKSSRYVGDEIIIPEIDNSIKKIGVFVNATDLFINESIQKYSLDGIQLHGDEGLNYIKNIRSINTDLIIFKALQMATENDLMNLNLYNDYCDGLILDTKGKNYGGTGKQWDYSLIKGIEFELPFLLSGGIKPEFTKGIDGTISEYLKNIHENCVGLDINSGFELSPGLKNISQIKEFTHEIKQ